MFTSSTAANQWNSVAMPWERMRSCSGPAVAMDLMGLPNTVQAVKHSVTLFVVAKADLNAAAAAADFDEAMDALEADAPSTVMQRIHLVGDLVAPLLARAGDVSGGYVLGVRVSSSLPTGASVASPAPRCLHQAACIKLPVSCCLHPSSSCMHLLCAVLLQVASLPQRVAHVRRQVAREHHPAVSTVAHVTCR